MGSPVVPPRPTAVGDGAIALSLLLTAAVLRVWALNPAGLWLDDTWQASVHLAEGWREIFEVNPTAPGFTILLRGLYDLVGFGDLRSQAVPFLCGVLAPPAVFLVLARRGVRRPAALLGALLLATSAMHIRYSDRVKPFTMDTLSGVVLVALAWSVLDDPRRGRRWAALGVAGAATLVLSASIAPVVVGAIAVPALALWRDRSVRPRAALTAGIAGAFTVGWMVLVVLPRVTDVLTHWWADGYIATDSPGHLLTDLVSQPARMFFFSRWRLGIPLLVLFVLCAVIAARRHPARTAVVLSPLVIAVGLAVAGRAPIGGGRTDLYLYGPIVMTWALGADALATRKRGLTITLAACGAALLTTGIASPYPRDHSLEFTGIVAANRQPGDAIVVTRQFTWAWALYRDPRAQLVDTDTTAQGFRLRYRDPDVFAFFRTHDAVLDNASDELRLIAQRHDRIWVLAGFFEAKPRNIAPTLRHMGYLRVRHILADAGQLSLWVNPPDVPLVGYVPAARRERQLSAPAPPPCRRPCRAIPAGAGRAAR